MDYLRHNFGTSHQHKTIPVIHAVDGYQTPNLTINIPPKTKVKQHHKCHFMFIIHLVPLVLGKNICMQEKSQKWTKDVHRRQWDVAGGHGPTCHVERRHVVSPDGPTPLQCHLSMGWPPHCFSSVDPRRFDPNVHVELPWIHGPTVNQLEGPNRPPNCHSNHGNQPTCHATTSEGQPSSLDGKAVGWTVG